MQQDQAKGFREVFCVLKRKKEKIQLREAKLQKALGREENGFTEGVKRKGSRGVEIFIKGLLNTHFQKEKQSTGGEAEEPARFHPGTVTVCCIFYDFLHCSIQFPADIWGLF